MQTVLSTSMLSWTKQFSVVNYGQSWYFCQHGSFGGWSLVLRHHLVGLLMTSRLSGQRRTPDSLTSIIKRNQDHGREGLPSDWTSDQLSLTSAGWDRR